MYKFGDIIETKVNAEVVGEFDVLVCGGGTAGCVAALAAARNGASVALIEASPFLGGMMTEGNAGLTKFILHGKDADVQTRISDKLRDKPEDVQIVGGIPLEIAEELIRRKAAIGTAGTAGSYVYTDCQEFKILLYELLTEAGVKIFLHSPVCDVITEGGNIKGVITQTKTGRQAYLGSYVIDSTGDGDVAVLAGVPYVFGVGPDDEVYKQGLSELGVTHNIGLMFRIGGVNFDRFIKHLKDNPENYMIQPFGLMTLDECVKAYELGEMVIFRGIMSSGRSFQVYNYPQKGIMIGLGGVSEHGRNGLDITELTRTEYECMINARQQVLELREMVPGFEEAYVLDTPKAGVRETRHIEGEYKLNIADILTQREFDDTIGKSCHPIDINPKPAGLDDIEVPDEWYFNIPYSCLVAKGIDNLLVAGRCISATREASGCIRPTAACMVVGEAAGTAASICQKRGITSVKDIDIHELRSTLEDNGVIL